MSGLVQIAFDRADGAQLVMSRGRVMERERVGERDGRPAYSDWRLVATVEGSPAYRHARILTIAAERGYITADQAPAEASSNGGAADPPPVVIRGQLAPENGPRVPVVVEYHGTLPDGHLVARQDKGGGLEVRGETMLAVVAQVAERPADDPAVVALAERLTTRMTAELAARENPPNG